MTHPEYATRLREVEAECERLRAQLVDARSVATTAYRELARRDRDSPWDEVAGLLATAAYVERKRGDEARERAEEHFRYAEACKSEGRAAEARAEAAGSDRDEWQRQAAQNFATAERRGKERDAARAEAAELRRKVEGLAKEAEHEARRCEADMRAALTRDMEIHFATWSTAHEAHAKSLRSLLAPKEKTT